MAGRMLVFITLTSIFPFVAEADSVFVSAPANVPRNASDIVSHAFQSWACAVHSWPDYGGNHSHPNVFSRSLVEIIANKTGSSPHFRVGGTSGDRTTFVANQTTAVEYDTLPGTQIPENVTIGPSFYEAFDTFANLGTQWTYMVNLAFNGTGHVENALAEARHAVNTVGSNLEAIEIGNEVDAYVAQGVRPPGWTETDYVREWHAIATPLLEQVLDGNNASIDSSWIFQAFAVTEANAQDNFTIAKGFQAGIDSGHNVKSVSIHHYMTGYTPATTLQASFMNHTEIVSNVSAWLTWKDYLYEHHPNVPLYIGEANSDPVTNTLPITFELQAVFGSALWKVDILMYAMSQSIPRYYVQQGTGFAFDSWQPVQINDTDPKVLAPWYGDVFIADVIGSEPDIRVANIDLNDSLMSAYAVYVSDALSKYVVVNLEEWNTTTEYSRPEATVTITVPDYVVSADVRYLSAPGAEMMTDISWAGQSWNYSASANGQLEATGALHSMTVEPQGGTIKINLNASQAVLVALARDQLLVQT